MNAVIARPETKFDVPVANPNLLLERFTSEPGPRQEPTRPSVFAAVLRTAILLAFGAGALAFIVFGLVPAVLLALVLLLPALAPFILVGLGILFAEDAERSRERQNDVLDQPCSCHHDRMQRALQNG